MYKKHWYSHFCLLCMSLYLLIIPTPARVLADPSQPLVITNETDGVHLTWRAPVPTPQTMSTGTADEPLVTIGGVRVPAQLITLRVDNDMPLVPQITQIASTPWPFDLQIADPPIPQTVDGDVRPALAKPPADPTPPDSPMVVLREGQIRGVRIAVLALSPIFDQAGTTRAVTTMAATLPGTQLLTQTAAELMAQAEPIIASAPTPNLPGVQAWKVRVAQAGIQRLTASTLSAAGISLTNPSLIHLRYNGTEVALEQRDSGNNLELRFYAVTPGDRWNAADTYWLTVEADAGLRMSTRQPLGDTVPAGVARDQGVWRGNSIYDSTLPGPNGDHWFSADLKTAPDSDTIPASITVPLTHTLTPAAGTTTLTLSGSAYTSGPHTLAVTMATETHTASWNGTGNWSQTFPFTANSANALVTLLHGTALDGVELDSVAWDRPVTLNVAGQGTMFTGADGTFQYTISNAAVDRTLYDVTTPQTPSIVNIATGKTITFADAPARRYVLAGTGTLFTPSVIQYQPFDFTTASQALYIAPTTFQSALAPLVAQRQAQGFSTRIINVQAIYDAWSFGQVSPTAIRNFLRYAVATWQPAPIAVTLVGDGTSDPLNHLRRDNENLMPPYLAMVDPWLYETACDVCYARLDGDDPTTDLLPDLLIGRLSVNSTTELSGVIAKIIKYENSPIDLTWQARNLYISDNFRETDGSKDNAGDFAAFADVSAAQQPAGIQVQRMYYDPSSTASGVPWREPDALRAHDRAIAALNQGVGLFNYTGHGSQYQLAVTDPAQTPPWLVGLYDVDALTNGARLPIVLEMTCLTGAFQTPAYSKTTIDERLLIKADGGAVAIWGPTGLGITYGHDALQRGFYNALWNTAPLRSRLGELTLAGEFELFTNGGCCQETLATYILLGDPLTPARILPASQQTFLPVSRKR